jgi:hypothetical protein
MHLPPAHLNIKIQQGKQCAKPSSTAEEPLWNAFGDNLTAKRRSMETEKLATIVYAKMNMFLLDCSQS